MEQGLFLHQLQAKHSSAALGGLGRGPFLSFLPFLIELPTQACCSRR
jgi:hypothetical protein